MATLPVCAAILLATLCTVQPTAALGVEAGTPHSPLAASRFDPEREAHAALDLLFTGAAADLHARFGTAMANAVSAEQLAQSWTSINTAVGALQHRGNAVVETKGDSTLVTLPLTFERGVLNALVAFDPEHRIVGFALRPPKPPAVAAPPIAADARYSEIEVRVGADDDGLPATLTLPKGGAPVPAVVLVHGSGPHDRDETIGPNKPFLDLARGLADRGIAVLRYEKRTRAHGAAFMAAGPHIDRETTDDAVLALALLRQHEGIDPQRVYVLGHSLGGMLAPRIAQRAPEVAGLILLAAPARSVLDILIEQHQRLALLNDSVVSADEAQAIQRLTDDVQTVRAGGEPADLQSLMGLSAGYWRGVEAVNPIADALAIPQPILILQGARDLQVVEADWQRWMKMADATPRLQFKLYPTLNHLGIAGEGEPTLEEYGRPGQVSPELIADIATWVHAQPQAEHPTAPPIAPPTR